MTPTKRRELARLTHSFHDLAARGMISKDLASLSCEVVTLGLAKGDNQALYLSCVMSRFLAEVEAGTASSWAFSMVSGAESSARLRLVKKQPVEASKG